MTPGGLFVSLYRNFKGSATRSLTEGYSWYHTIHHQGAYRKGYN